MRRILTAIAITAAIIAIPGPTHADSHPLVVDHVTYQPTHIAGSVYQFETPDTNPQEAYFAERDQWWHPGDNGTDKLPCPYGIHWVSNDNVLTISHCLEAPSSSTTSSTTTTPPSTSSSTSTTSTSTLPAETTTVPESTSTSSPSTTSPAATSTVASTSPPSAPTSTVNSSTPSSTFPTTPSTSATSAPSTTVTVVGTSPTSTVAPNLPPTGSNSTMAAFALAVLALGVIALVLSRYRGAR